MCGEQGLVLIVAAACVGSPPRVRGTGLCKKEKPSCCRITPACAGNRSNSLSITPAFRDHPRVCGEQCLSAKTGKITLGSPPRVRGTVRQRLSAGGFLGITPACAGNSLLQRQQHRLVEDHPRVCGEQAPDHETNSSV